jgi:hypothetical protein
MKNCNWKVLKLANTKRNSTIYIVIRAQWRENMKGDSLVKAKTRNDGRSSELQGTLHKKRRRIATPFKSNTEVRRTDTGARGGGWPLQATAHSGLAVWLKLNLFSLYSICYDRMRSDDFSGLYPRSLQGHENFRYSFHGDGCSSGCERWIQVRVPWVLLYYLSTNESGQLSRYDRLRSRRARKKCSVLGQGMKFVSSTQHPYWI